MARKERLKRAKVPRHFIFTGGNFAVFVYKKHVQETTPHEICLAYGSHVDFTMAINWSYFLHLWIVPLRGLLRKFQE
tara:strand:+ start:163 stop:393 length:231 start_codon:yes stop_codon:yes gene_type:complete